MQWEVTGADRTTGNETSLIIEADNEDSAKRRANRRGLLVANARPLDAEDTAIAMGYAAPPAAQLQQPSPPRRAGPVCQLCGGSMTKKTLSSGNCGGLALALIVLVVGLIITVAIPVIGWVIGPLIMVCALFMGGKRSRVWRCVSCGAIAPRA